MISVVLVSPLRLFPTSVEGRIRFRTGTLVEVVFCTREWTLVCASLRDCVLGVLFFQCVIFEGLLLWNSRGHPVLCDRKVREASGPAVVCWEEKGRRLWKACARTENDIGCSWPEITEKT